MPNKFGILGLAIIGLTTAAVASPVLAEGGKQHGGKHNPERRAERMIQRIDANGDSKVSLQELQARVSTAFVAFDADKNGEVSRDEVKAKRVAFSEARKAIRESQTEDKTAAMSALRETRGEMLPGVRGKRFAKADTDGNGSLNKAEVDTIVQAMFKRRDKNADGFIDAGDFTRKI